MLNGDSACVQDAPNDMCARAHTLNRALAHTKKEVAAATTTTTTTNNEKPFASRNIIWIIYYMCSSV